MDFTRHRYRITYRDRFSKLQTVPIIVTSAIQAVQTLHQLGYDMTAWSTATRPHDFIARALDVRRPIKKLQMSTTTPTPTTPESIWRKYWRTAK